MVANHTIFRISIGMAANAFTFGPFRLDPDDRRLTRDGEPIDVSARYLDALILLASENGRLVTKDRFMAEVWRGIPVTDEALTQCIRALRRALGDDASAPRYIETVPRHGYRLVAPVGVAAADLHGRRRGNADWRVASVGLDILAASVGGGVAGIVGGLGYLTLGLITPGIGTASTLLVLISVNLVLGFFGGAAVGAGAVAGERLARQRIWGFAIGGAAGGLLIGSIGKMVGHDLFSLFFGRDPGATTGALEGLLLGAATGLAIGAAWEARQKRAAYLIGAALGCGAIAGFAIVICGGRLMAGSLSELATRFPELNLHVGGAISGTDGWSTFALLVATIGEAALFTLCVAGAVFIGRRIRRAD